MAPRGVGWGMKTTMEGYVLLAQALRRVESQSIREWAMTDHNRPILHQLATLAVEEKGPSADPDHFAAFIVAKAIGLY